MENEFGLCLCCGEPLEKNDDGNIECSDCGEEFNPSSEKGFLSYGQNGIDGFCSDTVGKLAEAMDNDGAENVLDLFIDQRSLGTGAIEIIPTKASIDALERALEWAKVQWMKETFKKGKK